MLHQIKPYQYHVTISDRYHTLVMFFFILHVLVIHKHITMNSSSLGGRLAWLACN